MKRTLLWVWMIALLGSSALVSASAAVKAGGTCTKVNSTSIVNGYKYTCIKSGNKLVWNKGVKIVEKAVPAPIAAASSSPKPSPSTSSSSTVNQISEPTLPTSGTDCTNFGEKIKTSYGFIRCDFFGGNTIKWREHRVPVISTSLSNNYKTTPVSGELCTQSGDSFNITGGYLECRYINGGKLAWMKIDNIKNKFQNTLSPDGTDVCKLKNSDIDESKLPENTRAGVRDPHIAAGFPTIPRATWTSPGLQKAIVVGVDFPELRGKDSDLKAINALDKKTSEDWYSYFSNGKFKYELTTIDHWFHSTKSAKSYSDISGSDSRAVDGNAKHDVVNQEIIDMITNEVDLRPFTTIYIIFPNGEITLDRDWVTRDRTFKIKEGTKNFNVFGWGKDNELMGTMRWAYYVHEVLHDAPLIGHAPGNGWPFGIMAQQSGISMSPFAWEQFQLDWLPDNQIYCIDKVKLTKSVVSLTPMEREDSQTKMAVIKLSKTQALVIESHGIDKWSSFNWNDRSYPAGFYGVMAYVVDIQNAVAPPNTADGRAIVDDTGNDPKYPRWAYWQKVDGAISFLAEFDFRSGSEPYNGYIAVLGDSFTVQGVKVKLTGAGDYETITIEKVG